MTSFKHMNKRFDDVDKKFDQVMNILVEYSGWFDDIEMELTEINSQLSRHD